MPDRILKKPLHGGLLLLLMLAASILLFSLTPIDSLLQDRLWDAAGRHWLVDRNDKLLRWLFYDGVKLLYILLVLSCWAALVGSLRRRSRLRRMRGRLLIVCMSLVLAPVSVGLLKAVTDLPCPRQLQRYGGELPHVSLLQRLSGEAPALQSKCYPAGHASGGFALISLLFLFNSPAWRRRMLWLGLVTGWTIGGYKMAIGDHFLSHTWVSMLWVGLVILALGGLFCSCRRQKLADFLGIGGASAQPVQGRL